MTKDNLENYIYENLTESVDISNEMFNEFLKNGRLDITITKETNIIVEQQSNTSTNPFVEATIEAKETTSKNNIEIAKYSLFKSGNGKDAGTILMDFLDEGLYHM